MAKIGNAPFGEGKYGIHPLVIEPKRMRLDADDPFFAAGSLGRFYAFAAVLQEEDGETSNKRTTTLVQGDDDLFEEEDENDEDFFANTFACTASGCPARFRTVSSFEAHLFSRHRHRCSVCQRDLTTPRLLDMHIAELHDSYFAVMAKKRPSYACLVDDCRVVCSTNDERRKHLIQEHHYPLYFDFHNPGRFRKKMSNALREKENVKDGHNNGEATSVKEFNTLSDPDSMETGSGGSKAKSKHVPCKFFFGSGCRFEGDVCNFSHDLIPRSKRGTKGESKQSCAGTEMEVDTALEDLTSSFSSCNLFVPKSISFGRGKGRQKFCSR